MNSFLQTRFSSPHETRPHYDSTQELHFSGENWDVMQSLAAGQAKLLEVNVLYTNNVPEQIHAVYAGGETGQNIDAYLKGNALKDYLNK